MMSPQPHHLGKGRGGGGYRVDGKRPPIVLVKESATRGMMYVGQVPYLQPFLGVISAAVQQNMFRPVTVHTMLYFQK